MKNCEPLVLGPAFAIATALVARATTPTAFGAAALDHELRHHPVEREAVVVPLAREPHEVVHRVRRELRVEVHHDRTAVGGDGRAVDLRSVDLVLRRFAHGIPLRGWTWSWWTAPQCPLRPP